MAATRTVPKNWYPSEERELARLRLLGYSTLEIARQLGRSRQAVRGQIARYPGRYPKRSRLDLWYDLLQVTHTIAGAAQKMGVQPHTVSRAKYVLRQKGKEIGPAKKEKRS